MAITNIGVLFGEENFGNPVFSRLRIAAVSTSTLEPTYLDDTLLLNITAQSSSQISQIKVIKYLTISVAAQSASQVFAYVDRTRPQTAKLSSYTITPTTTSHLDYALDNLLSQFKECPNVEKLLDSPLTELQQAQTDVYEFQDEILNIENAEGVNLDICGQIVGALRKVGQGDLIYRNIIMAQIFANNCDGTIPKILSALITRYNLEPGSTTKGQIQLTTMSHNRIQVYIRDYSFLVFHGGKEAVQQLISAGGIAQIVVNDPDTEFGDYFAFDSVDGDDDDLGGGWGSVDDSGIGAGLVAIYNVEDFYNESGQATGPALLTTTKKIPVETFP